MLFGLKSTVFEIVSNSLSLPLVERLPFVAGYFPARDGWPPGLVQLLESGLADIENLGKKLIPVQCTWTHLVWHAILKILVVSIK